MIFTRKKLIIILSILFSIIIYIKIQKVEIADDISQLKNLDEDDEYLKVDNLEIKDLNSKTTHLLPSNLNGLSYIFVLTSKGSSRLKNMRKVEIEAGLTFNYIQHEKPDSANTFNLLKTGNQTG